MQDFEYSWLKIGVEKGIIKTPSIIDAFQKIRREDFLPKELKYAAQVDSALPLMKGQTISQPTTVAIMLELLNPEKGYKILEIGSGSGWQTALLAHIVGENGKIFALEIVPELKEYAEKRIGWVRTCSRGTVNRRSPKGPEPNCSDPSKGLETKFLGSLGEIEIIFRDGKQGLKEHAPFDRIIAACYAPEVPSALLEQLSNEHGRLVMPVGEPYMQDIILVVKNNGKISKKYFPGFVFVPLV